MEWIITITAIALLAGLTVYSGWRAGRPARDTARTQWISWPLMTVLFGAGLAFALVHAMSLMGLHTGGNVTGRYPGA